MKLPPNRGIHRSTWMCLGSKTRCLDQCWLYNNTWFIVRWYPQSWSISPHASPNKRHPIFNRKAKSQTHFSTYAQRYAAGNGVKVRTIFFGGSFHICFFSIPWRGPTALDFLRDRAGKPPWPAVHLCLCRVTVTKQQLVWQWQWVEI